MVTQKKVKNVKLRKQSQWNWLEESSVHEKQGFTFPQVKPSLLLLETPSSLDRKVPMVPGPKDVVVLSTTKIGTKRFQIPPDAEFDLTDPCRRPLEYNFLHDPHLRDYLNNPLVKTTLAEKGLVTKDGYVKCTIKEFNDYRQWIRKLKLNAIDQEFHLKTLNSKSKDNITDYKNNDALHLTRKRQERAKELYQKKLKIKEDDKRRYLDYMDEQDQRVKNMKLENKKFYEQKKSTRKKERDIMKTKHELNENKRKRIRFKILINSKKNIEQHHENAQKLQQEKIAEKEKRAEELWKRRQSYCLDKMNVEKELKESKEMKRRESITKRESSYEKERRKSDAYMAHFAKENRDNAMRHMEEASEFLEKIEAKKEAEVKKWREKLKCIKEREKLLNYYRHKKLQEKRTVKLRRRHSKSRKSVWDVDQVLLKEILCHMTDNERKELEDFHSELENTEENQTTDAVPSIREVEEPIDQVEAANQSTNDSTNQMEIGLTDQLEIGLTGHHRSFITFGNIQADDVIEVFHEDEHPVEVDHAQHVMLDIPGLIIEHTRSVHDHLPCVDDDHDLKELDHQQEEVIEITENNNEDKDTISIESHSSYEILVIPSRTASEEDVSVKEISSEVTLIHVIDDVPVLVSSASIHTSPQLKSVTEKEIVGTAHAVVLASLGNAAKNLGYSKDVIYKEIGVKLNEDNSVTALDREDINVKEVEEITKYAKEITEMSLIGAAVSLGYDSKEIAHALGVDPCDKNLLTIAADYEECIKNMAGEAVFNAALSLGFNEEEAQKALQDIIPNQVMSPQSPTLEAKKSSVSILSSQLVKNAISSAIKKLGFNEHITESFSNLNGSVLNSTKSSLLSFSSLDSNEYEEPFVSVAQNALRSAALALGYSQEEVKRIIGEEMINKEDATIQKWAHNITHNAIKKGKESLQEAITKHCEQYVNKNCDSENLSHEFKVEEMYDSSFVTTASSSVHQNEVDSFYHTVQDESEYLIRRFSSSHQKPTKCERDIEFIAEDLATSAITLAAKTLGYNNDEINSALEQCKEEESEAAYSEVAQIFVSAILQKSIETVHKEQEESKRKLEEKKLERAAVKFTMVVIGSACKTLGYSENQILQAIADDTSRRASGITEIHPSIAVKFNETSISNARKESLSIPDRGRRGSVKDRPATPKPSKEEVERMNNGITDDEEVIADKSTKAATKSRRLTPFFDNDFQQNLIKQYEKEQSIKDNIIEEDEEDEDSEATRNSPVQESVHIITSHCSIFKDFSNLSEGDIMCRIEEEQCNDVAILKELSEYPREEEFLKYANKSNLTPAISHNAHSNERSLMNLLGQQEIAPGILELYNAIQVDIMKLLSSTNSMLLQSKPSTCNPTISASPYSNHQADKSYLHTHPTQTLLSCQEITPSINVNDAMSNNDEANSLTTSTSSTSKTMLPKIDTSSHNFLVSPKRSQSRSANSKSSLLSSSSRSTLPKSPSLPKVRSTISSRSRLLQVKGSKVESLPNVSRSRSVIDSQNEVVTNMEEPEIVIKSDGGFGNPTNKGYVNVGLEPTVNNVMVYSTDKDSLGKCKHSIKSLKNISPSKNKKLSKSGSCKTQAVKEIQNSPKKSKEMICSPKKSNEIVGLPKKSKEIIGLPKMSKEIICSLKKSNEIASLTKKSNENVGSPKKSKENECSIKKSKENDVFVTAVESDGITHKVVILSNHDEVTQIHGVPHYALPLKRDSIKDEHAQQKSSSVLDGGASVFERLAISKRQVAQSKEDGIEKSTGDITNKKTSVKLKASSNRIIKEKQLSQETVQHQPIRAAPQVGESSHVAMKKELKDKSSTTSKHTRPKSSNFNRKIMKSLSSVEYQEKEFVKSSSYSKEKQNPEPNTAVKKKSSLRTKRKSKKSITKTKNVNSKDLVSEHHDEAVQSKHHESKNTKIKESNEQIINPTHINTNNITGESAGDNAQLRNETQHKIESSNEITKTKSSVKPPSRKSLSRPSISRHLDRTQSRAAITASIKTVSLQFDKTFPQSTISRDVIKNEEFDESMEGVNPLAGSIVKSSIRFEPSPPKKPSYIGSSLSLKSFSASQRSMKSILKSRSLGSAGKIMATDSRQRHHSSSFRESLPMMSLNEQGDCTDFSNINSQAEIQSRRNSSQVQSSSTMWVPSHSVANESEGQSNVEPSPSALLVKSATPSRQVSASSFKSGHIFVTPVASINFASTNTENPTRNPSATSRTSTMEIVENQVSGTHISKHSSALNVSQRVNEATNSENE